MSEATPTTEPTTPEPAEQTFTQAQLDEQTAGLKKALQAERQNSKGAKAWADLGVTPDEVRQMLDAKAKAAEEQALAKGDFEKILAQKEQDWSKQLEAATNEASGAKKALQTFVAEAALSAELAKGGANAEGVQALPKLFDRRISVGFEDNKPTLRVMMADGETPMAGSAQDGTAIVADLVAEAKKTFPSLFNSEMKSGSGMQPNINGGTPSMKRSEMTAQQAHDYQEKHGQEAYLSLPK